MTNSINPRSICFVAGTLEHGGAERQLFYILRALRNARTNLHVISLDKGQHWEKHIVNLGIPVTYAGANESRFARLIRITREIQRIAPDVVQSQHFYANGYAALAARLLRRYGIGALRNNGESEVNESGRFGGWANLHAPNVLAANSRQAISFARSRGVPEKKLVFLPNAVDTEKFIPTESVSPRRPILIAVGRLVKQKRLDRFIKIIERLRSVHRIDVRGLIVGPGCAHENLHSELEVQARGLGLTEDVLEFRGGVANTTSVFQEATACVLTSDHEGTPNVILEAMACGLPIFASRVGGVADIVTEGLTGHLFQPDDLDGFVSALAHLLHNPAARMEMGRQGRLFVETNHSLHRLPVVLERLYARVPAGSERWSSHASEQASI